MDRAGNRPSRRTKAVAQTHADNVDGDTTRTKTI